MTTQQTFADGLAFRFAPGQPLKRDVSEKKRGKGGKVRATIMQAIEGMKIIEFNYDGYPRVVEPHCFGVTTAGNQAIRCYQIAGGSASGKVPG